MQEILSGPGVAARAGGASGPLLWALAGFALYLLCAIASLFITVLIADPLLTAIGLPVEAGTLGLSVRNALHPAVWGALVAAVSIPIGRRLVDGIRFSGAGWVVLGVGLVLATLTWFLSEEFVRARFESFDPEYVGLSLFAWPALVAVALCGWAALAVPRTGATPVIVLLVLAAAGLAVALLPSMGGASDGIEPGSVPLAVAFLVDVAYAISVIALVFRGATRPAPG